MVTRSSSHVPAQDRDTPGSGRTWVRTVCGREGSQQRPCRSVTGGHPPGTTEGSRGQLRSQQRDSPSGGCPVRPQRVHCPGSLPGPAPASLAPGPGWRAMSSFGFKATWLRSQRNAPPCFCPTPWPRPPRPTAPGRRGHDLHPDLSPFSWASLSGLGSSVWGARPPGWQLHCSVRPPQIADIRARHTEGLCPQDTKQSLGAGQHPLASLPPPPAGLWGHQ